MRTLEIGKNDANQRLDKFLQKRFKTMPKAMMYMYIRKKCVKLNGKKCDIDSRLHEGDVLTFYIKDEFFEQSEQKSYEFMKAPAKFDIVYEDENILLIDKKPGVIVHPDKSYHFDSLVSRVQHYLYEKGEYDPALENSFAPALANRIDRNTGGLVLAAKNAAALRILNEKIKNREVTKLYKCIAVGRMPKKSDTLTAYLRKDSDKNKVFISKTPAPDAKKIVTKYRELGFKDGLSLLEIDLLTGRTHQIRAQLSAVGHPLLGDGKYGTNAVNKKFGGYKKQCLYAFSVTFDFESDGGVLEYLNKKTFSTTDVWFEKAFSDGTL